MGEDAVQTTQFLGFGLKLSRRLLRKPPAGDDADQSPYDSTEEAADIWDHGTTIYPCRLIEVALTAHVPIPVDPGCTAASQLPSVPLAIPPPRHIAERLAGQDDGL
jgi:hypothetical protein